MISTSTFIPTGALLVLTLVSGIWLGHIGKPLNPMLFNLHKLIALATVILAAIQIAKMLRGIAGPVYLIVLVAMIGLCVLVLFLTGALISIGKLDQPELQITHMVVAILATGGLAVMAFLHIV